MKTIGISLSGFILLFAIPNLHRASEVPTIFDALAVGMFIAIVFLTIGLYRDIITSQHSKED